jgi:hypothetical protein
MRWVNMILHVNTWVFNLHENGLPEKSEKMKHGLKSACDIKTKNNLR